ncbi:MAG: transglycosylase SLT domain-containing protein, partial [Oligoflexia bacterium]|nr:transglycosylase SLT domain-containing protein [Oligoflexia bacterium]
STPASNKQELSSTPTFPKRPFWRQRNTGQQSSLPTAPAKNQTSTQTTAPVENQTSTQTTAPTTEESESSPLSDQTKITYQISRDTYVLPAGTKEVQPGCFVIDRQETETEAGFCPTCKRSEENNSVLNFLTQSHSFVNSIQNYLKKVVVSSKDKIEKQTDGEGSDVQKICSPEISLKAIINNFNKTCPSPYNNNFKKFFKKAHCKSCKKGIPVELMLAMMSIESAGRCQAFAGNAFENSTGLFQVDGRQHGCRDEKGDTYKKNTQDNLQCLKDPINNLNKATHILVDRYKKTNPGSVSKGQCKNWMSLSPAERDSWRRGVSAYNGGPGWVTRAIKSARDQRTLQDTNYLSGTHKHIELRDKLDTASWEELRLFYFIEKLSPGNLGSRNLPECKNFLERDGGGTGRQLCLTVSNLAHTEAVLGRELKGSMGMVEIWSQYKAQFLKKHPVTCR